MGHHKDPMKPKDNTSSLLLKQHYQRTWTTTWIGRIEEEQKQKLLDTLNEALDQSSD